MADQPDRNDSLTALIERAHAALDVEDYRALADLLERFDHAVRQRAPSATGDDGETWPAVAEAFAALQERIVIGRDEASAALRSLHGSRHRAHAYGRTPGDAA